MYRGVYSIGTEKFYVQRRHIIGAGGVHIQRRTNGFEGFYIQRRMQAKKGYMYRGVYRDRRGLYTEAYTDRDRRGTCTETYTGAEGVVHIQRCTQIGTMNHFFFLK